MLRKIIFAVLLTTFFAPHLSAQDDEKQPTPQDLLRATTEFWAAQSEYKCRISVTTDMSSNGRKVNRESTTIFSIQRPNRFIMREDRKQGGVFMCDGESSYMLIPTLGAYVQSDAPKTFDDMLKSETDLGQIVRRNTGALALTSPFGGKVSLDQMLKGLTNSAYVGKEKIGDVLCHHCRFESEMMPWEVWIQTGDQPVPLKFVADASRQLAPGQEIEMEVTGVFSEWNFEPKFDPKDFQFDPPEDFRKVSTLAEAIGGDSADEEKLHDLVGKDAPIFTANNLDGDAVDLETILGNHIVILDFWATWCGPCVKAMPDLAEVAKRYEDKGVKFFAVNVNEESDTIEEFLKEQELDVDVLLDSDSSISQKYGVKGIPQTVIIGLKKKVQVVHVGLTPNFKNQLSKDLDALLNGEDLVADAKAKIAAAQEAENVEEFGTTPTWEQDGRYASVAVDNETKVVYAATSQNKVVSFDASGKPTDWSIAGAGNQLVLANLVAGDEPEVITYSPWGKSIDAVNRVGQSLWQDVVGQGIDDIWAADLTGNGADEVIIGYNGNTGLHVLDRHGREKWQNTDIGNVWHVCAGNVDDDDDIEVVTTSAQGQVHIFSSEGQNEKNLDVAVYASMVRVAATEPTKTKPASQKILVGGTGRVLAIDGDGTQEFMVRLPGGKNLHIDAMCVCRSRPWAAVGMRGGAVHVLDTNDGKLLATVSGQGKMPDVDWLERNDDSPLLITATGTAIKAFEIETK